MKLFNYLLSRIYSIFDDASSDNDPMGIRLGNFDPLQLIFGILDTSLRNNSITVEQAKSILRQSLPPEMSIEDKNKIVDSMVIERNNK